MSLPKLARLLCDEPFTSMVITDIVAMCLGALTQSKREPLASYPFTTMRWISESIKKESRTSAFAPSTFMNTRIVLPEDLNSNLFGVESIHDLCSRQKERCPVYFQLGQTYTPCGEASIEQVIAS